MPRRARLSRAAERDLSGIWRYGAETFGVAVADRYAAALASAINSLAEFPLMGAEVPNRRVPIRRISIESHIIFYQADDQGILVTRVLHQRMDWPDRI